MTIHLNDFLPNFSHDILERDIEDDINETYEKFQMLAPVLPFYDNYARNYISDLLDPGDVLLSFLTFIDRMGQNETVHKDRIIKAMFELAYDSNSLSSYQERLEHGNEPSIEMERDTYVNESMALLALGLFINFEDSLEEKKARVCALTKIYEERRHRYYHLACECPSYNGIIFQNCKVEDMLMARKALGILLDFQDSLTRKKVERYIRLFDRDRFHQSVELNRFLVLEEQETYMSNEYIHILHNLSIAFLLNVINGAEEIVLGSTFFQYSYHFLNIHHKNTICFDDITTSSIVTSHNSEENETKSVDPNLIEMCENILDYDFENDFIDTYEYALEAFMSNRMEEFHNLYDINTYYAYRNFVHLALAKMIEDYPDFPQRTDSEKSSVLHALIAHVDMMVERIRSKELLLQSVSDDVLDQLDQAVHEADTLRTENNSLKNEITILKKTMEKQQKSNDQERSQAILKTEKSYKAELTALQKKLREQEQKNDVLSMNQKELYQLREFLFTSNQEPAEHSNEVKDNAILHDYFSKHKVIFIGGHYSLLRKLRETYPSVITIDQQLLSNPELLKNCDTIFFFTAWMRHSQYEIAMDYIRKSNCAFTYLSGENQARVEHQICQFLHLVSAT